MDWKKSTPKVCIEDFTSCAENETKNEYNIKNVSTAAMGFIYVEVENVFTMLSKGDMKEMLKSNNLGMTNLIMKIKGKSMENLSPKHKINLS